MIGASAIALTGCFPLPPALPEAPTVQPADPVPAPETEAPEGSESAEPTDPSQEPVADDLPYTVDDGAGDTWSFDVTNLIADPPMESGEADPGTFFVGVVLSGQHIEGDASFSICFDIFVEGDDGQMYDWRTTDVTAENDVYYADDTAFTDAIAAVQLPEGVEPDQVVIRSTYGHPDVADTVIDVN